MSKMLSAVLHDFNDLKLEEVPVPRPTQPGTVVVRIRSCGICQTDYKAVKGIRRNVKFPLVPGHEPAGIVAAVGPGVTHFKEGDEVICQPSGFCGFCKHCRVGNTHYCESAFTTGGDGPDDVWAGAFAEYMLTKDTTLFHKPKNISFDAAALTEPLSGAWKGVIKYSQMQVGDDVVVLGTGGIGLLCMMVAKAAGPGRLIAVDPSPIARENAKKLGATHVIDPKAGDIKQQVYDVIKDGPDLIVEAAGNIHAVRDMVKLLRRGTRWNLFGITTEETFELDGGLMHFLEARMDASFGTNQEAMQMAIRLMERGVINTEAIISHHYPLQKIFDAMDTMSMPQRNKVMIHP